MENTFLTYYITGDVNNKLKNTARTSCNFWNRYISPRHYIVTQLGTFDSPGFVIARAYQPFTFGSIRYGFVEFNEKYLITFDHYDIIGTLVHEMGHILGMGFGNWMDLFNHNDGSFKEYAIEAVPALQYMFVETDYGPGTELSHWDERRFTTEIMTGIQDSKETVLPVTIDVMSLLGHHVNYHLPYVMDFDHLISLVEGVQFTRKDQARELNKAHRQETKLHEEIIYTFH